MKVGLPSEFARQVCRVLNNKSITVDRGLPMPKLAGLIDITCFHRQV